MKDKFQRFMAGRYGVDELGKYSLYLTIALLILGLFVRSRFLKRRHLPPRPCSVLPHVFQELCPAQKRERDLFLKYKNQAVRFFQQGKTDDCRTG